jgi:hypothetical protein
MLSSLAAARTKWVGIALTTAGLVLVGVAFPHDPLLGDPPRWVTVLEVIGLVLVGSGFMVFVISVAASTVIAISRRRRRIPR